MFGNFKVFSSSIIRTTIQKFKKQDPLETENFFQTPKTQNKRFFLSQEKIVGRKKSFQRNKNYRPINFFFGKQVFFDKTKHRETIFTLAWASLWKRDTRASVEAGFDGAATLSRSHSNERTSVQLVVCLVVQNNNHSPLTVPDTLKMLSRPIGSQSFIYSIHQRTESWVKIYS